MDKSNTPAPSTDDTDQNDAQATVNSVPNLPFGAGIDVQQAALLSNPYAQAAAAAALAMANQQMVAQSLQPNIAASTQQQNLAFGAPVANTTAQPATPAETIQVASAQINNNGLTNNNVTAPQNNVAQQVAATQIQQLAAFPFAAAQANPFAAAALLSAGGLLPGAAAMAAAQQGSVQQQLVNNTVLNGTPTTVAKKKKATKKGSKAKPARAQQQQGVPRSQAVAAAAAQVVAAHAAASTTLGMANAVFANMQHWKLDQLEAHVQLLRDSNQPVPQPVAMLLADARRKEEKRTAKRAANRKSACSSRARKKALVEEMTKANARLRRQAMILALLPDLVIAITADGKITFCSAQVERVLRHKIQHLVGANFEDILIPPSRDRLRELVRELLAAEQAAARAGPGAEGDPKASDAEIGPSSGQEISSGGEANQVSEGSFPLAVVNFANGPISAEDNSDLSASNGGGKSSDTRGSSPKEGVALEANDATQVKSDVSSGSGSNQQAQTQPSSDDSLSSSNDAKNLRKANEALGRNVRWHNEKLASEGKVGKKKSSHKDDVTGASVTANNASARLSSLQVRADPADAPTLKRKASSRYDSLEEQSSSSSSDLMLDAIAKKKARKNGIDNTSEDSGYRESNQSEEDTFDDSSSLRNGPRPKPLAPACNICLIRDDLTTIWCEVTSSIRTRSLKDENVDEQMGPLEAKIASASTTQSTDASKIGEEDPSSKDEIKELLLCLRPIRDGEETVDESLRFVPPKNVDLSDSTGLTDSADPSSSSTSVDVDGGKAKRPPKKRPIVSEPSSSSLSNDSNEKVKKRRVGEAVTEKSVVESLMLMGNNVN